MLSASLYRYTHGRSGHHHAYLLPTLMSLLNEIRPARIFDLGCGNGSIAAVLADNGYDVTGVDPSVDGIAMANKLHPRLNLSVGSAYDDLASKYGQFPCAISLEVVEHIYDPRCYAKTLFSLLEPGGVAIISTPYHGYLKNVAIAAMNKWDHHHSALWDHGHIKFWSITTLGKLLSEAGFADLHFHRVGRIRPFAKSMVAVAKSPHS